MTIFLVTGGNGFIGTNFITMLRKQWHTPYFVHIVDIQAPKIPLQNNEQWHNINILDKPAVFALFEQVQPQQVVHLAAETACLPHMVMSDYETNTIGSENIFDACQQYQVDFLVHTSTQFVHQAQTQPTSDTDYAPHTVYGESKIIAEKTLRQERYTFNWTIIRPTNVWGPWHLRYPYEFWKVMRDGKYFHPGQKKVIRSYGYVGNVCEQVLSIIQRRNEPVIARQVFYVGDEPINLLDWVNAFSLAIKKRPVRIIPTSFVYLLACGGSALQKCKISFPITLSRYKSMTSDNPAPMKKTFEVLGTPSVSLQEGVKITTEWLQHFWQTSRI
jgi:nucleoside-diphosphate-sugar epimerase